MHEIGPSFAGTVVLDVGADTGALVIYASREAHLREIEISPAGAPDAPRTHAAVRERHLPDRIAYAAVYSGLAQGQYTIWSQPLTPAGTVTVTGGRVSEFRL